MSAQIPFEFKLSEDFSAATFHTSSGNAQARAVLKQGGWTNNILALIGVQGTGKTHLGHIWANQNEAVILHGQEPFSPRANWAGRPIWIDDASQADGFTLFTLINMAIRGDTPALLLSDQQHPQYWPAEMPDLHSRLKNLQTVEIEPVDDALLGDIVRKMFKDRGLKIEDNLVTFMLRNCERSVPAVRELIGEIDHAAASQKAKISRVFVSNYLKRKN